MVSVRSVLYAARCEAGEVRMVRVALLILVGFLLAGFLGVAVAAETVVVLVSYNNILLRKGARMLGAIVTFRAVLRKKSIAANMLNK